MSGERRLGILAPHHVGVPAWAINRTMPDAQIFRVEIVDVFMPPAIVGDMETECTAQSQAIIARTRREMRLQTYRVLAWSVAALIGIAFWAAVIWAAYTYLP